MEDFTVILAIIFIVFGILQIILFFKVWGMTNYVKSIAIKLNCSKKWNSYQETQKALMLGDREKAKELIINDLVDELIKKDSRGYAEGYKEVVDEYTKILKKLNMEMPELLANIESRKDIIKF